MKIPNYISTIALIESRMFKDIKFEFLLYK